MNKLYIIEEKFKENLIQKIILIIFLIYFYFCGINKYIQKNYITIEVDTSLGKIEGGGPVQLQKGINKVLPYRTKKCSFIPVDKVYPTSEKEDVNYFFMVAPIIEYTYRKWTLYNRTQSLLIGPCFIPLRWSQFPWNIYWRERNLRELLLSIKAIVVHSSRVRNYLAEKSNNTDLLNKFIIMRACTYCLPKNIKPFNERNIDIILYEKYPDLNRRKQGKKLFKLLKGTNKRIEKLKRGNYTRDTEFKLAYDTKFIIYFSFYDTGAIALKEIQNYGVIAFTLQKDLAFDNKTSYYIPELEDNDITPAFNKIMKIIDDINKINPNTKMIADINQNYTKCERALDDLCDGLMKN